MTNKLQGVTPTKLKKPRSTAYPAIPIEKALEYSEVLIASYATNSFDRDNAARAMGFNRASGDVAMKISALVHYGLLDRSRNSYSNSEIANKIKFFESEDERLLQIRRATLKPKLFATLVKNYAGRAIPLMLHNTLVASHGITASVAEGLSKNFAKSLEYSGILQNGVISADVSTETSDFGIESGQEERFVTLSKDNSSVTPQSQPSEGYITENPVQSIDLPSGLRITYPQKMGYLFAVGQFGSQIKALEDAVQEYLTTIDDDFTETQATKD